MTQTVQLKRRVSPRSPTDERRLVRRARVLAWGGIAWHAIEFVVAVGAGLAAGSVALIGFGIDSAIESAAGVTLLWRLARGPHTERRAQQLIAASFFLLAGYIVLEGIRTLASGDHPRTSWVGIALAAVTAVAMPLLARAKRDVGRRLGSSATVQEGAQNQVCAYLSLALLAGLGLNALLGWWWADPAAAVVIAAVAVREGIRSWRGDGCCDVC